MLDLHGSGLSLELSLPTVLLQTVQQSQHVGQPQRLQLDIGLSALLDSLLDLADGALYETPDVLIVVDVVEVSDQHEENVSWEPGQHLGCKSGLQLRYDNSQKLVLLFLVVLQHAEIVVLLLDDDRHALLGVSDLYVLLLVQGLHNCKLKVSKNKGSHHNVYLHSPAISSCTS